METVGVVGAGAMGSVFVELFRRAEVRTLVYDVSADAVDRAVALGAEACASPAEIARQADVVDVMVRTNEQLLDCVLGPQGALEGLTPGKVLLLHSSTLPETTRTIAAAVQPRGIVVADACITAVPAVLRAYRAACLVGGEPEVVERIRPHLLRLAPQIIHTGPLGCGNAAKILRNLVNGTESLVLHEAFQLARAAGIGSEQFLQVLNQVYASRVPLAAFEDFDPRGPASNLYDPILPSARALADTYHMAAPATRHLASADKPLF